MVELTYLDAINIFIGIVALLTLYIALLTYTKVTYIKGKSGTLDLYKEDLIKDRNYYIYQLLKKTLKEYGYRKYDIKNRASAPKEYTIQGREDGSKSIFELREFIEENIPKDVSVLVYIDKRKKVLEVMYYDKDKELALGGNNHVQVHHKGKFTIVTAK